ncbi:GIY-YIG nuclease family protein [Streptomyces natalensis]|uniref:GIY-YIG nuclease family protein n=1 Tax=Streptomyces natalensis TaxID=68242 RepID=UPI000AD54C3E|nr:GIY-YIG nuclease family protein [Streptomyces natalensis]
MTSNGRTALYRLRAADHRLLYVGISTNPDMRWGQHSITKPWWSAVEYRELEWHESRALAESAERAAIRNEHPIWNVVHAVSDAASRTDIPAKILRAMRMRDRADLAVVDAHNQLVESVVSALLVGMIGPTRAAQLAGWEPCTVRKYARLHAVPPTPPGLKTPTKWSKSRGIPVDEVVERQMEAEDAIKAAVRRLKTCRARLAKRKTEVTDAIREGRSPRSSAPPDA